ncbi:MAG: endo-alpha-N-acetylgalactosaminidase family protein [Bifidobacteriaceae bacterium]|jgi:hypothetical protein|nr:endo-alpha-N-acetylgalactosaminidase family protein [Bifidobacteriaceae bacterium]
MRRKQTNGRRTRRVLGLGVVMALAAAAAVTPLTPVMALEAAPGAESGLNLIYHTDFVDSSTDSTWTAGPVNGQDWWSNPSGAGLINQKDQAELPSSGVNVGNPDTWYTNPTLTDSQTQYVAVGLAPLDPTTAQRGSFFIMGHLQDSNAAIVVDFNFKAPSGAFNFFKGSWVVPGVIDGSSDEVSWISDPWNNTMSLGTYSATNPYLIETWFSPVEGQPTQTLVTVRMTNASSGLRLGERSWTVDNAAVAGAGSVGFFATDPAASSVRLTSFTYRADADGPTAPSAATEVSLSGPVGEVVGAASEPFTVTPNGGFTGTITPVATGLTGTFTPASLTWTGLPVPRTFTFTPAEEGEATISLTGLGDATLKPPAGLTFEAVKARPELRSMSLKLPATTGFTGEAVISPDRKVHVTIPENYTGSKVWAAEFEVDDPCVEVSVGGIEQISGVSTQDFTNPVEYTVRVGSYAKTYTVTAADWRSIPSFHYDGDATGQPERPFALNYHQQLNMKLYLDDPTLPAPQYTAETALELIKQVDNATLGMPKLIYLVGWQFTGHDTGYPRLDVANERLKRPQDATAAESLQWLYDEAKKYNTTISFHMNLSDAYMVEQLGQDYRDNGWLMLSKGSPQVSWNNPNYGSAYRIDLKKAWEAGAVVDRLEEMFAEFPFLLDAGSIHPDVFIAYSGDGRTAAENADARRMITRYLRDRGVDMTTEYVQDDGTGRTDLVGLQGMAWNANQPDIYYYTRDMAMADTGGATEATKFCVGFSIRGEPQFKNGINGWQSEFSRQFGLNSALHAYVRSHDFVSRTEAKGATWSNGLTCDYQSSTERTITQNGVTIRTGDDLFVPLTWGETGRVMAYSLNGYTDQRWVLPPDMAAASQVHVYRVTSQGLVQLAAAPVADGAVRLSLKARDTVLVALNPQSALPTDWSALEAVVEEASGLDEAAYTAESWAALQTAVNGAQAVLDNAEAAQWQVDAAIDTVRAAITGLEALPALAVRLVASTRCTAGKAQIAVFAFNDSPGTVASMKLHTPYGDKVFAAVPGGVSAYQLFTTRAKSHQGVSVELEAQASGMAPSSVFVEVPAASCG